MNYLFFLGDLSGKGGTEKACISVCNSIVQQVDSKVFLVVYNSKEVKSSYKIDKNVSLVYLNCPNWKLFYPLIIFKLLMIILKRKINFFISVEMYSLIFTIPIYFFKKIFFLRFKFVVWEHYNFNVTLNRKFRVFARKWAFRFADKIVLLTNSDLAVWNSKLGINEKLVVIPNGINLKEEESNYNKTSKSIIAVGRFDKIKRFDLLIDIWNRCLEKYGNEFKEWHINLIGEGELEDSYRVKIESLNLEKSFNICGYRTNINEIYENASIICMTSEYEGFGLVLLEAQSFGIPQVAFDCPVGPREIIKNGYTGYLIEDGDVDEFVEKLKFLVVNVDERVGFSVDSLNNSKNYSMNHIVLKWLEL